MLVFEGEPGVQVVAFTPDGTRLVVGRYGGGLDVWSLPARERVHTLAPFGDAPVSVAVHPAGRSAFVAAGRPLAVVSLDDGTVTSGPGGAGPVHQVVASPDGEWVVANRHHRGRRLHGFRCTPKGQLRSAWVVEPPDVLHLGKPVGRGDRFVSFIRRGMVLRDTTTGEPRGEVAYPSNYVYHHEASPCGGRFAAMGYEKLYVWDTAAWEKPTRVPCSGGRQFTSFAFHPTRPLFAGVQSGQTLVKFLDTATWKLVARFQWKLGMMRGVAFSPDGTLAAAGSAGGKVVVWDVDG